MAEGVSYPVSSSAFKIGTGSPRSENLTFSSETTVSLVCFWGSSGAVFFTGGCRLLGQRDAHHTLKSAYLLDFRTISLICCKPKQSRMSLYFAAGGQVAEFLSMEVRSSVLAEIWGWHCEAQYLFYPPPRTCKRVAGNCLEHLHKSTIFSSQPDPVLAPFNPLRH